MKKQLLTGALMLAGVMTLTNSAEAKSAMDDCLELVWMNTGVSATTNFQTDCRQATVVNGKFYIQNHTAGKIEIWDETGKTGELESGLGTNITRDDKGNILVRVGVFPNGAVEGKNEVRIIPANGDAAIDQPIAKITTGRADFWGHVAGDVMSETGGIMYTGTQWQPGMIEIPFIKGKQDVNNTYNYGYKNPFGIGGQFSTTSLVSSFSCDPDAVSLLSPFKDKTNDNSIQRLELDNDGNWVHKAYYITPRHNSCAGFFIFKMGEQKYIVYSTGANHADGFSIAKLATKESSAKEDSDEAVRVGTKYAEMKEDGSDAMYSGNAFYGNHFFVEVESEKIAYIYQYYPNGYIAKYKFTDPTQSGVEEVAEAKAVVTGGNGEINVTGAENIEIYSVNGVLVSKNEANVQVAPGIYLVKTDNNVAKVLVK